MPAIEPGKLIYPEAAFRLVGDRYIYMEFGGEPTVVLNVRVVAMRKALANAHIRGIQGYTMTPRSIAIVYDPLAVTHQYVCQALREVEREAQHVETVPSRLFVIPCWYGDPWTSECATAHKVPNNLEFVATVNNLAPDEFVARIATVEFWVAAVYFYIGAYNAFPLDNSDVWSAPKYRVPRTWTPDRTVAYAGTFVGSYALPGPGGYQMLGRSAVNFFELERKNRIFKETGRSILVEHGDRHIYRSIGEAEYWEIWNQVEQGTYEYEVRHESFNIKRYSEAVLRGDKIDPSDFVERRQ